MGNTCCKNSNVETKKTEFSNETAQNPIDVSNISPEYRKAWSLGNSTMKQATSMNTSLKAALQRHYVKKGEDAHYAEECDKQRDDAFLACDVNGNGKLDLDEWKVFCKVQCQNVSNRIGETMIPNDEPTQEAQWKYN